MSGNGSESGGKSADNRLKTSNKGGGGKSPVMRLKVTDHGGLTQSAPTVDVAHRNNNNDHADLASNNSDMPSIAVAVTSPRKPAEPSPRVARGRSMSFAGSKNPSKPAPSATPPETETQPKHRRRNSQDSLAVNPAGPNRKKKTTLLSAVGQLLGKSHRNNTEDLEERSARLDNSQNTVEIKEKAKQKTKSKDNVEDKPKVSRPDGAGHAGGGKHKEEHAKNSDESNEGDQSHDKDRHEDKKDKVVINPKTGQPKRYFYNLNTIDDMPEDVKLRVKDSGLPNEYFNDHLQDFVYCLRFVTRDSFRLASKPELDPPDTRPNCSEEMLRLAMESIRKPAKDLKKQYRHLIPSGKGGYGEVFGAKETDSKQHVAIKKVSHSTKKDIQHNFAEVAFLASCKHRNIVEFKCAWHVEDEEAVWIVTEFLEGGTLGTASKAHKFGEKHISFVAHEILQALRYLHAKNYAHRDLKSANVMLSIHGDVKLIDFGLAVDLGSLNGTRTQLLGSPFWLPPEMIKHVPHNTKVDIWSFAVCILELYLGNIPYGHSRLDCMFRAVTGRLPDILSKCSSMGNAGRDFMLRCLKVEPSERASAEQLLAHPFMSNAVKSREGIESILRTIFVNRTLALAGI